MEDRLEALFAARPWAMSPDELVAFAAGGLASYKKPRSIEIVSELPISATGIG